MVTAGKTDNNGGRYGKSASAQVDQRFDFVYGFLYGTAVTANYFGGTLTAAWGCMILHNLVLFSMYFVYYRSGRWNPLGKGKAHPEGWNI